MAAASHFGLSINNYGIQEFMRHTPETEAVFLHHYHFHSGYLTLDEKPGLGVDFDERLASKYPYERAYLPINRKLDGTMYK